LLNLFEKQQSNFFLHFLGHEDIRNFLAGSLSPIN